MRALCRQELAAARRRHDVDRRVRHRPVSRRPRRLGRRHAQRLATRRPAPSSRWLSAVDWASEVAVGEPVADSRRPRRALRGAVPARPRVDGPDAAHLRHRASPKDDAWVDSLVGVFAGADWHEREAAEMFGIDFLGHPNLVKLYLPDCLRGQPAAQVFPAAWPRGEAVAGDGRRRGHADRPRTSRRPPRATQPGSERWR